MLAHQSRFEKFITRIPGGCWTWVGAKTPKGYGRFHLDGNKHAHRVAYELYKGAMPAGLVLDHLCRNPACVNPDHLEPVTHLENIRRGDHTGKGWRRALTHCPQGHAYTEENTYAEVKGDGRKYRHCKTCICERNRERNRAKEGVES
jgi:hypothetical protein